MSDSTQATQAPVPETAAENVPTGQSTGKTKTGRDKKPRTEAQQAATAKALAAMTAARKQRAEKVKEKKEEIKQAKKIIENKVIKEDLSFVLKSDFEAIKKELADLKSFHSQQATKAAPKAVVPERIVERVVERVPTQPAQPAKLTGHALLDKLFFEK